MTLQNFQQNIKYDFDYSAKKFVNWPFLQNNKERTVRLSNVAFLNLQEILKNILFLCHEISKPRFAKGAKSNGLNLISWIKGIAGQGLGYFFITSSNSYFFNQTNLEIMDLTSLTSHHWQPCFSKFMTSDKDEFAKCLAEYRTSASRCLFCNKIFFHIFI